ncbi:MAG: hypothetical protein ABSG46_00065 [Candidatus Binataceae bacterium]|jgi:hypothetical protein
MNRIIFALMILPVCGGCTMYSSHEAHKAQNTMVGMSDYALESCVGAPDQKAQVGNAEILTYYATTTDNGVNLTMPIIGGGVSLTGSGYCHATFTLVDGRVTQVHYTGDNSQLLAPQSICAPIVKACLPKPESSSTTASAASPDQGQDLPPVSYESTTAMSEPQRANPNN